MAASENGFFRGQISSLPSEPIEDGELESGPSLLSNQELVVLTWLSGGLSNKEIAYKMVISPETVKTHISSIFDKLGVNSRTGAALIYQRTVDICEPFFINEGNPRVKVGLFLTTLMRVAQEKDRSTEMQVGLLELLKESAKVEQRKRDRDRQEQEARKKRWEEERRKRRKAIVLGLAEGRTVQEIAEELGIRKRSVRQTISFLYKKLGIDGRDPLRRRKLLIEIASKAWDI